MTRPDEEAPEADALEQATLANPIDGADEEPQTPHPGMEVPEWDGAEQLIDVPMDDDRLPEQ